MTTIATVTFPKVEDLRAAVAAALEESSNYEDGGYYTEYHFDRNDCDYGEDGNRVESAWLDGSIQWNPETNEFLIPTTLTYGHGSKYNDGDYITDEESCVVLVSNANEGEAAVGEIVDYDTRDGFVTLDEESAEMDAAMDGVETEIDFDY